MKNNKILRNNLSKEMKDLCNKNYKISIEEIEDTNEWKTSHVCELE